MPHDSNYLFSKLRELGITFSTIEHPPVRTVEEARLHCYHLPGGHVKNLFIRDKRKQYWMIVAPSEAVIDLRATAQLLGTQKFNFANADRLYEVLGILPGSVSPFAVINDESGLVKVVLDQRLVEITPLNFHPLTNELTTTIATADFLKFLQAVRHQPLTVRLPGD